MNEQIKMNIVSLFSGCGGLDLGFKNQGFDIIWAIDFDKGAVQTYKNNLGSHIIYDDIKNIDYNNIPDCDMIIGGSPCQGFSNLNRMTHYLDNPKNFLVREYIKIVKIKQPKIFVLENVPQILTCGNGQFKEEIIKALNDYNIEYGVLNSIDFGVAQERKRAIFIGSKIGKINLPFTTIKNYKTVGEAFKNIDNLINQNDYSKPKKETEICMSYVKPGGNFQNIPLEIRPKGSHSNFYKRLELNKPSITITNPRKSVIIHPIENRILSIRECARIQDFPDNFIFYGTLAEKQQQIANAVPVGLAEAVAKQIKKYIIQ